MSTDSTAQLIEVKNGILRTEKDMKDIISELCKKRKIDFDRTDDHGARGFNLEIYFDELNIECIDDFAKLKPLYVEFTRLKRQQKSLEEVYNSDKAVTKQMKDSLKGRYS